MIVKLLKSICVWYVYHPHVTMLRLLGPVLSLALTRVLAHAHWLLTFVGSHALARRSLAEVLHEIQPGLSVREALRRYLIVKHQAFTELYIHPTPRGRAFLQRTYSDIEGREYLDQAHAGGRGVIVLIYHFGLAKMVWPALQAAGYDNYHHVFRGATFAGATTDGVARAAMDALTRVEEQSGLKVIYHRPVFTFHTLVQHLRANHIVGMNGDGMIGGDFADVPFLNRSMMFPRGVARIAASSGAPIVPAFMLLEGLTRHRLVLHEPIACASNAPEDVDACVGKCTGVLDDYVRRYPWAWWTWRRLRVLRDDAGTRFKALALSAEDGISYTPPPNRPATADAPRESVAS